MTRVFLRPDVATIDQSNGIGRVIHAQHRWLPKFGIQFVGSPDEADVVAGHTHDHGAARIDCAMIHGLYWTGDKGSGEYTNYHREANARIIASVRRARAITVPSNWVAMPFMRDMRLRPEVIGHGIELDEWEPPREADKYILWNKNRNSDVCDPTPAYQLALKGQWVMSTFLPKGRDNLATITLTGATSSEKMHDLVQRADIYLATTKETFGIGTLEALASGVPVLGFDHGGTSDLVRHKENGYLVAPGDLDGLLEGVAYIRAHRRELSRSARESALAYSWERACEKYAALFHRLTAETEPTGVAVVIPCHNYAAYLGECIKSVVDQTYRVDEIIVVDDGSTDKSLAIAREWAARDSRVTVHAQPNSGVAAARNNGVALTRQPLVVCLDADDRLDPRYVAACRDEMLRDRGIGLAWTGMSMLRAGQNPDVNVWTGPFDWEWQAGAATPPHTTIPTGAMFRRALWERSGGYKQKYAPGEDAAFYTHGLALGFTAKKVTEMPWYIYRDHGRGAHRSKPYVAIDDYSPWMRDREYPLAAPSVEAPNVRSYSAPKVSVIIPVGPGHAKYLPDALESVVGQTMREWEVVVVDDGIFDEDNIGEGMQPYPFARFVATAMPGGRGPGAARNTGLQHVKAPLVLFLDADDMLSPTALADLCGAYAQAGGRYVYGDWQIMGASQPQTEAEYSAEAWLDFRDLGGKHAVTVLMATDDARRIGFDETLPAWEDWDFFAHAAVDGVQGQHVPGVTLFVRRTENSRTEHALKWGNGTDALAKLKSKWEGSVPNMPCGGGCGGAGQAVMAAKDAWNGVPQARAPGGSIRQTANGRGGIVVDDGNIKWVRMEYTGTCMGLRTFHGLRGSNRSYRASAQKGEKFKEIYPADVEVLEATGDWRRIGVVLPSEPAAPVAKPEPAKAAAEHAPAVSEAVEVAPVAEQVSVIDTGEGPVKRKRGAAKKSAGKQSELKDLPPLDAKA